MALEIRDLRSHLRHLRRRRPRIRPRGGVAAIGDGGDGGEQGGGGHDDGDPSDRAGEAAVAPEVEAAVDGEEAEGKEDAEEEEESPIRDRSRHYRHGSEESISPSSWARRSEAPVALSGTPKTRTGEEEATLIYALRFVAPLTWACGPHLNGPNMLWVRKKGTRVGLECSAAPYVRIFYYIFLFILIFFIGKLQISSYSSNFLIIVLCNLKCISLVSIIFFSFFRQLLCQPFIKLYIKNFRYPT